MATEQVHIGDGSGSNSAKVWGCQAEVSSKVRHGPRNAGTRVVKSRKCDQQDNIRKSDKKPSRELIIGGDEFATERFGKRQINAVVHGAAMGQCDLHGTDEDVADWMELRCGLQHVIQQNHGLAGSDPFLPFGGNECVSNLGDEYIGRMQIVNAGDVIVSESDRTLRIGFVENPLQCDAAVGHVGHD